MKLFHYIFIIVLIILFLSFPFLLFYFAFYSGSLIFKDYVNNHVELFYLLFMLIGVAFSIFATTYLHNRNILNKDHKAMMLFFLKVIIAIYAVILVLNSTSRFIAYKSEAIDVSFFKREIWQISSFEVPSWQWSQHFSPILYSYVPIFWLFKDATLLMFSQALFVVSGVLPLYFIIKEKLKSQFLGLAIIASYLTFGGLQFGYAYGFHEIMLLPPLFFWAYYFLIKKRIKLYYFFILLCLFVKEEVSFIMVFWGLYLLYKKNYRYAAGTILLGILWYFLCFNIIFPYFNQGNDFGYWGQYANSKDGIFGIVYFVLSQPFEFLKTIITPKYKVDTILHSFGNFSFLSFIYPPSLIMVIPSLFEKLLSSNIAAKNGFHYSAAITAVVIVSVIESIYSIQRKKILSKILKNTNIFLGILIFYVAISANMLYGYHPLSPLLIGREGGLTEQQLQVLNQAVDLIPAGATVAAQYYIGSHINKPYWLVRDGPGKNETADYVIVHMGLPLVMSEREYLEQNVKNLINEGRYLAVINEGGTLLFKRIK